MSRRNTFLVVAVALIALLTFGLMWSRQGRRDAPARERKAAAEQASTAAEDTAAHATPHGDKLAPGAARKPALAPARREALARALAGAREQRLARGAHSGASAASVEPVAPLALANKTGSNDEWEQRQIAVLNQLLAECYDLAAAEAPGLAGQLGIRFTIAAEPEIGGLVDDIALDEEYTTIEQPTLRECVRESLFALELEPPPEGTQVSRELTLRFDPD